MTGQEMKWKDMPIGAPYHCDIHHIEKLDQETFKCTVCGELVASKIFTDDFLRTHKLSEFLTHCIPHTCVKTKEESDRRLKLISMLDKSYNSAMEILEPMVLSKPVTNDLKLHHCERCGMGFEERPFLWIHKLFRLCETRKIG